MMKYSRASCYITNLPRLKLALTKFARRENMRCFAVSGVFEYLVYMLSENQRISVSPVNIQVGKVEDGFTALQDGKVEERVQASKMVFK